jgi:hypothetical protein
LSEEDLREVFSDAQLRVQFANKLACVPLNAYEEPLPVFDGWPDAPCACVQFAPNPAFELMYEDRFAYARLEGNHLHMLIELHSVVQALLD